jgi:hypothetical protein
LPPWVPRKSWRSASICTNSESCPLMNGVIAAASSSNSSLMLSVVAIFLIGSSTVLNASVDSGFVPPSATPAAADVAVPSTA